jgi:hypothetical protein
LLVAVAVAVLGLVLAVVLAGTGKALLRLLRKAIQLLLEPAD